MSWAKFYQTNFIALPSDLWIEFYHFWRFMA